MSKATLAAVTGTTFIYAYALNYARKATGKRSKGRYDDNTAHDLAQNAFLKWWESHTGNHTPMDTRYAIRCALFDHYRSQKRVQRAALIKGNSETIRDMKRDIPDLIPEDGTKTAKQLRTVIQWLATGASQADIAAHLKVNFQRVSALVAKLRTMFPASYFATYSETEPMRPEQPIEECDLPRATVAKGSSFARNCTSHVPSTIGHTSEQEPIVCPVCNGWANGVSVQQASQCAHCAAVIQVMAEPMELARHGYQWDGSGI